MKREIQWLGFLCIAFVVVSDTQAADMPPRDVSTVVRRPHGRSLDLTEHVKRERARSVSPAVLAGQGVRKIRSAANSPQGGGCGVDSPE